MVPVRRELLIKFLKLFDLLVMIFGFVLAALLVSNRGETSTFADFLSMRIKVENFILVFVLVALWHIVFASWRLYGSQRLVPWRSEMLDILRATTIGAVVIAAICIIFKVRMATPQFLVSFWLITTSVTILCRLFLRFFLQNVRRRGRGLRHVIFVGTSPRSVAFARKLESRVESGFKIVGFVDEPWGGLEKFLSSGYPLVCDFSQLAEFLRQSVVDEVIIGLPLSSYYDRASTIAALCELHGIGVRFLPQLFDLKIAKPRAEEFAGDSLITLSTGPMDEWPVVWKRVLDFTVALSLLLGLLPLLLVVAVLIKLTSDGPALFTQERLGLNKRRFRIYKFRTMRVGAEKQQAQLERFNELSGPVFKIKHDPRVTPLGRVLRKASIDELPQLFNVLKGEMSLVGPRPLPVRDYEGFDQDWHRRRFSVRPGITCLWQISGRNSIGFDKWMELDMRYIDEWSLWLDIRILAGTIPAVLRGSGAA